MTILRACVTCGRPSRESYCAAHKPKPWEGSKRRERMGMSNGSWETVRRKVLARDLGSRAPARFRRPAGLRG